MNKYLKVALNLTIFLLVIGFLWYSAATLNMEEQLLNSKRPSQESPFVSPYQRIRSFDLPAEINRFELVANRLFISAGQSVYINDLHGNQLSHFQVNPTVRDFTVADQLIYLLYPAAVEVYSLEGELIKRWEACSELSDYCSLALTRDNLFVTDAENKNICIYSREGNFIRFVQSPNNFIIPSYSFDIESHNDTIYCVNSGRHLIEKYTSSGDYIAAFGGTDQQEGFFSGCCNPSFITFTSTGHLMTSEKGVPRICAFSPNGKFEEIILNSKNLGGGTKAFQVKAQDDTLYIAEKNKLVLFLYQPENSENSPINNQ